MLPDLAQWTTALGVGAPLIVAGMLLLVLGTRSHSRAMSRMERQQERADQEQERTGRQLDETMRLLRAERERCDRLERRVEVLEQTARMRGEGWPG